MFGYAPVDNRQTIYGSTACLIVVVIIIVCQSLFSLVVQYFQPAFVSFKYFELSLEPDP